MKIDVANVMAFIKENPDTVVSETEVMRRVMGIAKGGRVSAETLKEVAGQAFFAKFKEQYIIS